MAKAYEPSQEAYKIVYEYIEELKRKAQACDNYIAEVRERVKITVNTEDDIDIETQKVTDYYMEDE